jgi:hypothetical protein
VAAPVAATPAARSDPFGLAANSNGESAASSAHEGEEDISFGFDEPARASTPVAAVVGTVVAAPVAVVPNVPRAEPAPATATMVAAVSHSVAAAAAPAVAAAITASGNGHGASSEAITAATREVIEQIVWEIVPELAESIIREEIARLLRDRT